MEEDILQNTFDLTVESYDLDANNVPSVDEAWRRDILEEADLAVLSESEYETARENAQPYLSVYTEDNATF
jgi:sugar/nucleoside kinase (ribokinase family)